jgi:Na+-transporting methylmalonyl-CoA/oxaloacetate decarboxylase beta subunit
MKISKSTEGTFLALGLGLIFVILPIAILWPTHSPGSNFRAIFDYALAVVITFGIMFLGIGAGLRLRRITRGY